MSIFSEIKVYPLDTKGGNLLANGTFVVSEAVKVRFMYMDSKKGPFVSLPSDKVVRDGETKYYPQVNFITKDANEELNKLVSAAYEKYKNGSTNGDSNSSGSEKTGSEDFNRYDDSLPF